MMLFTSNLQAYEPFSRGRSGYWAGLGLVLILAGAVLSCRSTGAGPAMPASIEGQHLYVAHCAACHGTTGKGNGPAAIALDVRPRDFRREPIRYISTLNGVPTQEDLEQTVLSGRHFGAMPARPNLTDSEVTLLADYVREINRLGWVDRLIEQFEEEEEEYEEEQIEAISRRRVKPGEPIHVPCLPPGFRSDTAVGREIYMARCASCHGATGRGDGLDKPLDERGKQISVRDLTAGEFRGGIDREEIFKRIRCGVPGTPMPAQEGMDNEEMWQLVYYVQFLAGRRW
ncbi:MAG: cytochrome c [Planctomycetes bacterium]|nr:cytochrome c [Planctomycetota bacterium]